MTEPTPLPPYARQSVTTPDGTPVLGWSWPPAPVADIPRCRCSHLKRQHGTDRRDKATCFGSAQCACTTYRPQADPPAIPARFDERYDPSPEPIDRSIQ
jgi:hypothetical protein